MSATPSTLLTVRCGLCNFALVDGGVPFSRMDLDILSDWWFSLKGVLINKEIHNKWCCINCIREARLYFDDYTLEENEFRWWPEIADPLYPYFKKGWLKSCSVQVKKITDDEIKAHLKHELSAKETQISGLRGASYEQCIHCNSLVDLVKMPGHVLKPICSICNEEFGCSNRLAQHLKKCKRPTARERRQEKHQETSVSNENASIIWKCTWCDESFESVHKLQIHIKFHNCRTKCNVCGLMMLIFADKFKCVRCKTEVMLDSIMEDQLPVKESRKPPVACINWQCDKCPKSFETRDKLRSHLRIECRPRCAKCGILKRNHRGRYSCPRCIPAKMVKTASGKYKQKVQELSPKKTSVETKAPIFPKPWRCSSCSSQFNNRETFRHHLKFGGCSPNCTKCGALKSVNDSAREFRCRACESKEVVKPFESWEFISSNRTSKKPWQYQNQKNSKLRNKITSNSIPEQGQENNSAAVSQVSSLVSEMTAPKSIVVKLKRCKHCKNFFKRSVMQSHEKKVSCRNCRQVLHCKKNRSLHVIQCWRTCAECDPPRNFRTEASLKLHCSVEHRPAQDLEQAFPDHGNRGQALQTGSSVAEELTADGTKKRRLHREKQFSGVQQFSFCCPHCKRKICPSLWTQHFQYLKCHLCKMQFPCKSLKKAHNAEPCLTCWACTPPRILKTYESGDEHLEECHPPPLGYAWRKMSLRLSPPCIYCGMPLSEVHCSAKETVQQCKINSKSTFGCGLCPEKFTYRGKLLSHLNSIHGKEMQYSCRICNDLFTTIKSLHLHRALKHNISVSPSKNEDTVDGINANCDVRAEEQLTLTCPLCQVSFFDKVEAISHIETLHDVGETIMECSYCVKTFDTQSLRTNHYCPKKPTFKCFYCNSSMYASFLLMHYEDKTCSTCNKSFPCDSLFVKHQLGRRFDCEFCDKIFCESDCLVEHVKNNHGIDSYSVPWLALEEKDQLAGCSVCKIYFPSKFHQEEHKIQCHTIFVCNLCGESLVASNFLEHMENVHLIDDEEDSEMIELANNVNVGNAVAMKLCVDDKNFLYYCRQQNDDVNSECKMFTCSICKICFLEKNDAEEHMLEVHLKVVLFCKICGKGLPSYKSFLLHLEASGHSKSNENAIGQKCCVENDAYFSCHICGEHIVNESCIDQHINLEHLKTKNFVCCNVEFPTLNDFQMHNKYSHSAFKMALPFPCQKCDTSFESSLKFVEHVKNNSLLLKACTLCPAILEAGHFVLHLLQHHKKDVKDEDISALSTYAKSPENQDFEYNCVLVVKEENIASEDFD